MNPLIAIARTRPLVGVIALMSALASFTLGGMVGAGRFAAEWRSEIIQSASLHLPRGEAADVERMEDFLSALRARREVAGARALGEEETAALLAPWLGESVSGLSLPLPGLVEITLDLEARAPQGGLESWIAERLPGARLERHSQWNGALLEALFFLYLTGGLVLFMALFAAGAVVSLAARAVVAANGQVIEILHLFGAEDSFIAARLRRPFVGLGLKAGAAGALGGGSALGLLSLRPLWESDPVFTLMPLGFAPALWDYALLLLIPICAALLARGAAGREVLRTLRRAP